MAEYSALDENSGGGGSARSPSTREGPSRPNLRPFAKPVPSNLSEPLNSASFVADEEDGNGEGRVIVDPGDPFYVFRDDLCRKLEQVDEALAEFLRLVHQTDTSVNVHELKDAKKQLKRHLKNAEAVLGDVHATVQLVEKDRDKFSRIDSAELYERKALVSTSHERLNMAKQEMQSDTVKEKILADERAKTLRRAGGNMGAESDIERQNTDFIVDSQARASLLMRQQDETLEDLDFAVTRVGHIAETIHEEIGAQNKMLDEMDQDLAVAEEELGIVMGKLAKLLKTKNKCQLGTILCLTATAIVLFLLVLYT